MVKILKRILINLRYDLKAITLVRALALGPAAVPLAMFLSVSGKEKEEKRSNMPSKNSSGLNAFML